MTVISDYGNGIPLSIKLLFQKNLNYFSNVRHRRPISNHFDLVNKIYDATYLHIVKTFLIVSILRSAFRYYRILPIPVRAQQRKLCPDQFSIPFSYRNPSTCTSTCRGRSTNFSTSISSRPNDLRASERAEARACELEQIPSAIKAIVLMLGGCPLTSLMEDVYCLKD